MNIRGTSPRAEAAVVVTHLHLVLRSRRVETYLYTISVHRVMLN
jgi:hypothetical protein